MSDVESQKLETLVENWPALNQRAPPGAAEVDDGRTADGVDAAAGLQRPCARAGKWKKVLHRRTGAVMIREDYTMRNTRTAAEWPTTEIINLLERANGRQLYQILRFLRGFLAGVPDDRKE